MVLDGGANAVLVGTATHDGNATFTVKSADNGSRPGFILNGGEVDTTTFGTRFKMSVTRDDNTSDLMVAGDNTADRFKFLVMAMLLITIILMVLFLIKELNKISETVIHNGMI